MKEEYSFLVLPGDGVGREVVGAGTRVLEAVCKANGIVIKVHYDQIGGETFDLHGTFCLDETVTLAKNCDGVLVGAVGGPKWDDLSIDGSAADKDGLMRLRHELDAFVGLRPSRSYPALLGRTPFKPELVEGTDILVLREMCGGCFFREPKGITKGADGSRRGFDNYLYTSAEIERFARAGFELAGARGGRIDSMDKSNVLESNVLWRDCVARIGREEFPDIRLEHYYADNGFYQLMRRPNSFDIVLCDNLFGDICSDLAATVSGSLGMLPSACLPGLSPGGGPGIYEPVHGSAPDIAGQGVANPIGTILSVAMMFEFAMNRRDLCQQIHLAVEKTLDTGVMTPDLGGSQSTDAVTNSIIDNL